MKLLITTNQQGIDSFKSLESPQQKTSKHGDKISFSLDINTNPLDLLKETNYSDNFNKTTSENSKIEEIKGKLQQLSKDVFPWINEVTTIINCIMNEDNIKADEKLAIIYKTLQSKRNESDDQYAKTNPNSNKKRYFWTPFISNKNPEFPEALQELDNLLLTLERENNISDTPQQTLKLLGR